MSSAAETERSEKPDNPFKLKAALLVSMLAMVLAIPSMRGSNAAKEATHYNILAANAYAFYQAKDIRQTEYKIASDQLQIQLTQDELSAAARELIEKKVAEYDRTIKRYESEPETGEGKKELMAQAKSHEGQRDIALRRDPCFDHAEALLQIAIVLTSVALITAVVPLVYTAILLGVLGSLSTLNGFFLFY
jgi:hypothetical protein